MTDDLDKKYYRIDDVYELTGVPKSTLRYWETQFGELRPHRNSAGTRFYTPADVELVNVIKFLLKDKCLTIAGAREHLRRNRGQLSRRNETLQRLRAVRRQLTDLIDALDSRVRERRKG